MGDLGSLIGTVATNVAAAAGPVGRLGAGAGPVARPVASTRSVAGIENLLTAVAAEVALTTSIAGLPVVDSRLPPVAAAASDGMRGPITRRSDIDVVAAPAPIDVAAPVTSRPPIAERPAGAER